MYKDTVKGKGALGALSCVFMAQESWLSTTIIKIQPIRAKPGLSSTNESGSDLNIYFNNFKSSARAQRV